MPDIDTTAVSGVEARGYRRGATSADSWDQYVVPVRDRITSYVGRANTFRIPGLAGTSGQNLLSIHNATGSSILVEIKKIYLDVAQTVAKTVIPPVVRVHRVTVLPTGGTTCPKVAIDTANTSSSSLTILQGASVEGTAANITATIPASSIVTQHHAPRMLSAIGYEPADRMEFIEDTPITLRALEGLVLRLDYSVATSNPTTDIWVAGVYWEEYTRP